MSMQMMNECLFKFVTFYSLLTCCYFFRPCKPYAKVNVVYKKSVLNIMSTQLCSLSFIGLLPGNKIIIIVSRLNFSCDWNILLPCRFITISILNFFNIVSKYLTHIYNI